MKRARVGGWVVAGLCSILVAVAGAGFEATVEDVSGEAYFPAHHEASRSPNRPLWSASGDTLSEAYSIPRETIRSGLTELERLDLLTTARYSSPPGQPFSARRPNSYHLNPLLSPERRERQWQGLRDKHGEESFTSARALATTIGRPNHYTSIEALLRSIDTYGLPAVRAATARIAALHPANPMRHVGYIITLLQEATPDSP